MNSAVSSETTLSRWSSPEKKKNRSGSKRSGASVFIHSALRVATKNQTDSGRDAKAEDASWDRKHISFVSRQNLFFFLKQPPLGSSASAKKEEEDGSQEGGEVTTDQTFKRVSTRHQESIVEPLVNHQVPNNIRMIRVFLLRENPHPQRTINRRQVYKASLSTKNIHHKFTWIFSTFTKKKFVMSCQCVILNRVNTLHKHQALQRNARCFLLQEN